MHCYHIRSYVCKINYIYLQQNHVNNWHELNVDYSYSYSMVFHSLTIKCWKFEYFLQFFIPRMLRQIQIKLNILWQDIVSYGNKIETKQSKNISFTGNDRVFFIICLRRYRADILPIRQKTLSNQYLSTVINCYQDNRCGLRPHRF